LLKQILLIVSTAFFSIVLYRICWENSGMETIDRYGLLSAILLLLLYFSSDRIQNFFWREGESLIK